MRENRGMRGEHQTVDKRRKRIPTKTNSHNKRLAIHPSRSTHRLTQVSTHHEVFNRTLASNPSRHESSQIVHASRSLQPNPCLASITKYARILPRCVRVTKSSTESLPASITKYSRILPRCPRVTKSSTEPLIYPPQSRSIRR